MRGSWENSKQLCKPETQSRVCITVENSPNFLECLDEAVEHGKKSSIAFIKYFSKIILQMKGNAASFTSRLKQIFLIHAHISVQPIKPRV